MIYDARTNPRGYKLSIQQWSRDTRIMAIARMQGYRIPAATFTAPEATPARALLNHGVWRAWCPDCPFAAEDVWRGHNVFWCMRCGNLKAGRAWRPLIWPNNLEEIEAILADYPAPAQNWEPWGVPVDIKAEADAWVEHAAAMVDPEHGLSDNEAGGEDDPETYTTPVLAVTNAIIASSDANVDKGDIRYFRQFLSANPASSGLPLVSTGTDSAAFGQLGAAGLATDSVTNAKIAAANITAEKIQDGQITTAKIADANVTPAKLDRVYSRYTASTYTGNNGASRQITTSFIPTYVVITWVNGSASGVAHLFSSTAGTTIISTYTGAATVNSVSQDTTLHASDGFVVDAVGVNGVTNTSGVTYRYAAFG